MRCGREGRVVLLEALPPWIVLLGTVQPVLNVNQVRALQLLAGRGRGTRFSAAIVGSVESQGDRNRLALTE